MFQTSSKSNPCVLEFEALEDLIRMFFFNSDHADSRKTLPWEEGNVPSKYQYTVRLNKLITKEKNLKKIIHCTFCLDLPYNPVFED